ncbi:MAG: glycoside hydrolase family 127 protein [Kiritimatiellaeota bacterium]|nr:glycoside hydrolase family 127 protein [Kiritimatiellota bacterium]
MRHILTLTALLLAPLAGTAIANETEIHVMRQPTVSAADGFYTPNRAPLQPTAFMKLPLGSIEPRGWVRHQLELDATGIPGRFEEISKFLQFTNTGWVEPAKHGWEELPYWLRGHVSLAYTLKDEKLIANARKWIEAIIATRQAYGFFGPANLRCVEKGKAESFPHMCVIYPLCSYYEATGDQRVLELLTGFYRWLNQQPEVYFKSGWGGTRWSEHLVGIYWTYNRTGEASLLDLAKKIHAITADWTAGIRTAHNVNFSQGFREPAEFWLQAKDRTLLDAVEEHYRQMMDSHGQFPGGGFGGDEGRRPGYVDPRQGFETCGFIESMLSDEIMTRISGEPIWADRCEEIAFNSLPAALTPDHRALHYITSANSVQLDQTSKHLGQFGNGAMPMQAYAPSPHGYRCCPHNYGMAWPYFTESLWLATADHGLCASLYAASEVKAKVADGTAISVAEETDYPFGDTVTLRIASPQPVRFPLWLRVPRWCANAAVKINGTALEVNAPPLSYIVIKREWRDGDVVTLQLPMRVTTREWPRNRNAVSVDYGPLTFSLDIKEKWTAYDPEKNPAWPGSEVFPDSPWNYGLVPDQKYVIVHKPGALAANPFTHDNVPLTVRAQARKIPGWQTDDDGVVGSLQQSPALTTAPVENDTLIPMSAARLRITSFPTVTTAPAGHEWHAPPRCVVQPSSSFAEQPWMPQALFYGIEPARSRDQTVPRFTWWNHSGTREWLRYKFPKPVRVSAAAVYWFDDDGVKDWYVGSGAFAVPQSWSLQYHDGNTWKPVTPAGDYGTTCDCYNRVEFAPVVTTSLRLAVQLQRGKSGGIYVWKIFDGQTQLVPTTSKAAGQLIAAGTEMPTPHDAPVAETWFKPEALKDIKDGKTIMIWNDAGAGANDARTFSPTTGPTVIQSAINGLPMVHFDAQRKQMLTFPRTIEDDFTIAVVFRSRQGTGTRKLFCYGAPVLQGDVPNSKDDFGLSLNAKGELLAGTGNPDTSIASPVGFNDGQPHLAVFTRVKATGELRLFMDGKQVAAGKGGTQSLTAPHRLGIGVDTLNRNFFIGDIGEVVIFSRALDDVQRKNWEDQLLTRWGIEKK